MNFKGKFMLSTALALVCTVTGAAAQEAVVLDGVTLEGEVSQTQSATRIKRDAFVTPRSQTTITTAEASAQGAESLEEAVSYSPSVVIEMYGVDERFDNFWMRGFSVQQNGLYRDGMRQRTISFVGPRTEPFTIDAIDVLRGPTADLFGANDPGGLVNVRSKRPEFNFGAAAYTRFNSIGTKELGFDVTGAFSDNLAARAIVVLNDQGSDFEGIGGSRVHVSPSLTWKPSDATELTIYGQYQDDDVPDGFIAVPRSGTQLPGSFTAPTDFYAGDPDRTDIEMKQNFVGYEFEHDAGNVTVYSRGRYAESSALFRNAYPLLFVNSTYLMAGILGDPSIAQGLPSDIDGAVMGDFDVDQASTELSFDLGVSGDMQLGAMDVSYAAGVDHYRSTLDGLFATTARNVLIFSTGAQIAMPQEMGQSVDAMRNFSQTGLYLTAQGTQGPLTLDFGIRHDFINSDLDLINSTLGQSFPTKSKVDEGFNSVSLGASYKLTPDFLAYGSVSRSFAPAPLGINTAGGALELERSRAFEIGLRYDNGAMQFGIAAYDITKENASFAVNPTLPTMFSQAGEVQSRGVEATAAADLGHGFGLQGSYSYSDPKVTEDPFNAGKQIQLIPNHQASVWLTYDMQSTYGDWSFGLGGRFTGARFADLANTVELDSYGVIDASIGWERDNWTVNLAARNLADTTYYNYCGASDIPQGIGFDPLLPTGGRCYYGPGRELSLTIGTKF